MKKESDDTYETVSVVTGTAVRNAGLLELWFRFDEIRKTQKRNPDGTPIMFMNTMLYDRELTGKYSMARYLIDCKRGLLGALQYIEYMPDGKVKSSFSNDRSKAQLDPVVPDSIGENILEWGCLLYK
jgi:hypothetical protein